MNTLKTYLQSLPSNALAAAERLMTVFELYAFEAARGVATLVFQPNCKPSMDEAKKIYLPLTAFPKNESDWGGLLRFAKLLWCFLLHELGHAKRTKFKYFTESPSKLHFSLLNAIEDIWMEREEILDAPYRAEQLDAGARVLCDDGWFGTVEHYNEDGQQPASIITNYVLVVGRCDYRGQEFLEPLAKALDDAILRALPGGVRTGLNGLMKRIPAIRSTKQASQLATDILAMLEEEQRKEEEREKKEREQKKGEKNNEDKGKEQPEPGQGNAPPKQDGKDGKDGQQPDPNAQDAAGQGDRNAPPTPSKAEAIKQALADPGGAHLAKDLGDGLSDALAKASGDIDASKTCHRSVPVTHVPGSVGVNNTLAGPPLEVVTLKSIANSLRARLQDAFEAITDSRTSAAERGPRLNGRNLWRSNLSGVQPLFLQRTEGEQPAAAVQVLIDISGSMSGEPIQLACEACFIAAHTFHGIDGVVTSVGTFPGPHLLLDFEQEPGQAKHGMSVKAYGGTPLLPSLLWAIERLGQRDEPRKILLIATDGHTSDLHTCTQRLRQLERLGIETLGIGIGSHGAGIKGLMPDAPIVQSAAEFGPTLNKLLKKALVDYYRRAA